MGYIKDYIKKNYYNLKVHVFQMVRVNKTKILKMLIQSKKEDFHTNMI